MLGMALWGSTLIRIIILAFLSLYLMPIMLFIFDYPFQVFQFILISSFFVIGLSLPAARLRHMPYIDYTDRFRVTPKAVYLIFLIYVTSNYGVILDTFNSIVSNNFVSFVYQNTLDRYESYEMVSNYSLFQRISVIGFLMSGSLVASVSDNRMQVHIMLFIMIIIESMQLARYGVLFVSVTYFVEYVIRNNRHLQLLKFRSLFKKGLYVVSCLIAVFLFSAYYRIAGRVDDVLDVLIIKFAQYTIAMHEALLIWMADNSDSYATYFGSNSFAGVYKIFGFHTEQGFYKLTKTSFGATNIYTTFRGLLSDFGVIGTASILFLAGYAISKYSKVNMTFISYNLVRFIMIMILFCLISPMNYFNCVAAVIGSGIAIAGINFGKKYTEKLSP